MNKNIKDKEDLYLKAKEKYYAGNPIISDFEFDILEEELKNLGSNVINIVDGDTTEGERFKHFNPMLSLNKVQIKDNDFKEKDILRFLNRIPKTEIEITPKFDGSALSIIYKDGILDKALTRGNDKGGLDRTNKAKYIVPDKINVGGIIEIRGEIVIKSNLYYSKYVDKNNPKNPRNYVAGIFARDDIDKNILKDLDFIAYHAVENAIENPSYINNTMNFLAENGFNSSYDILIKKISTFEDFKNNYDIFKEYRENSCPYQLDGMVLKYPEKHRKKLGENSHHPKWALAIKFPPKEAKTKIIDIRWQLGSSGKITPIAVMEPVDLDGSMITNALLHNLSYIINKKASIGAEVIIQKKGDIIPQIVKITKESDLLLEIPKNCPECNSLTSRELGKTENTEHLICPNPLCSGKKLKKIERGIKSLRIDNLGPATIKSLYSAGIKSIEDFFDKNKYNKNELISSGFFKEGRSLDIIMESINNIKSLKIDLIINSLDFDDCGKTISEEIGKFISGVSYDFKGLNKSCIKKLTDPYSEETKRIKNFISILNNTGIKIEYFKEENKKDLILFEVTGSPKPYWNKKEDFMKFLEKIGFRHSPLNKSCEYLITDSYSSKSSKIKKASKLGTKILTYEYFHNKYNS